MTSATQLQWQGHSGTMTLYPSAPPKEPRRMITSLTPRQADEALAKLHVELYRAEDRQAMAANRLLHAAGAEFYYRGRRRVTDMTVAEAEAKCTTRAAYVTAYKATHGYIERERYTLPSGEVTEYDYHGTNWDDFQGTAHSADEPGEALESYDTATAEVARLNGEISDLEESYTGWSRFFLVTSSAGHIHSSMHCSTCRPTTRYGWLPNLSGKTEAEAVKELGPTLCTVCFPTAPLDWTSGKKLTAAQAAKKVTA